MFKWLASKVRLILRWLKEMATFWTSVGIMLFPVGLAILIQWPNWNIVAFVTMGTGVILGIVGFRRTIKEENDKHIKALQDEKRITAVIEQLKKDGNKHDREHERYMYLLGEIGERFGVSKGKTKAHSVIRDLRRKYRQPNKEKPND